MTKKKFKPMFQALQDILKRKKQAAKWTKSAQTNLILTGFEKEVTKLIPQSLGEHLKALHINDGRLVVACLDENLAASLKEREKEIVSALNRLVSGPPLVKQLYFLE